MGLTLDFNVVASMVFTFDFILPCSYCSPAYRWLGDWLERKGRRASELREKEALNSQLPLSLPLGRLGLYD